MLADELAAAVAGARTMAHVDNLTRLLWRGVAEGHIAEDRAEPISGALDARRAVLRGPVAVSARQAPRKPHRPVSPDRAKSIARRRQLALAGAVPGHIGANFTMAEIAALTVVAREVQRRQGHGCELPIDAIAAMAGTCRTVVQGALRHARALGLVSVTERRRRGHASDTNIVAIVSVEWLSWLRMKGGRVRKGEHHVLPRSESTCGHRGQHHSQVDIPGRSWSVPRQHIRGMIGTCHDREPG